MKSFRAAFTLIELMIVVAIIGILAAIAIGKFGDLVGRSRESTVKNNLGALRSALSIYYADNQSYPSGAVGDDQPTLSDALIPTYLKDIPNCYVAPYHVATQRVDNVSGTDYAANHPAENGHWFYVADDANGNHGTVAVECYHSDVRGSVWTSY